MQTTKTNNNGATKRGAKSSSTSPAPEASGLTPDRRGYELGLVEEFQEIIATELRDRVDGDECDLEFQAEPIIESTTKDSDLIVHLATFHSFESLGGAYAFTVHSGNGFFHSAGRYRHLTTRELRVQALIETLSSLAKTPGRVSIYTTFELSAQYLNEEVNLWRPAKFRQLSGVRDADGGWWHLLRGLYEERQAGISVVSPQYTPAIRYCERLAEMYYESGSTDLPHRAAVLESLEN